MEELHKDGSVVVNGNTKTPDKVVVAISPFGYKDLSTDIDGLLGNAKLCAGRGGEGIDVTKYAIVVDKPVDVGRMPFTLEGEPIYMVLYLAPHGLRKTYCMFYLTTKNVIINLIIARLQKI